MRSTRDARPIKMCPRRIPLARQEAAYKAVLEMQRAEFIEPSDSPWAVPVVMVPKKGFPLSPEARAKTAFSTNRGHWQFKVLCFGLCNTPAIFERLMDRVLDGIPRQQCLVYLDDILAHGSVPDQDSHDSSSFQSALVALGHELERVAAAGLKLHPECHFMSREVSFLGHRVGKEGISTMEDKVGAVRDWPTHTDQRQLKSFLGLASYYRRFVRGFSSIAALLNRLLPKDKAFTWTVECDVAFNTLKRALIEAPVLAPPDLTLPFILDTDASNVGMGGVQAQVGPEEERVVAYFNRTFDKHERHYFVTWQELLAVMASLKHFRYYLGGLPFTVRTDHYAFQWLMSFREPEGQVAHWLEELQPYDFTVVHRAGAHPSNADAMSRRPCTGVDVVGPFPTTDSGNRWVLMAMDYFTKWPEAYTLLDQEAETIVDTLTAGMFSRFGAAESIHSDQGRNVESCVFATMCESLGLHKTPTTPLHPQSDGLVERFNKMLGQQLAIVSSKHQRDWDKHLPMVLMACRSAVQDSTSCTPALLMLGREIRTPAEMAFGLEYAWRLQDCLETAHTFTREQLVNAGVRQKRNYDVHTRGRHFVAGELVRVYSQPLRKKGRCTNLDSHWVGPCSVLERVPQTKLQIAHSPCLPPCVTAWFP
ncbi:uncharacterized protein LOC135543829 [Oncorhynchus masou masou]|uniref:uncharacterized protein LOC135543829 n=1 Tax=Oncorhynchus masou masou TaxID=90313 RepID=UPI003183A156